jgi:glycosyltransferase involved in cell wall biosynthesis
MGKPIVSTNVGDVHKYITECKNGFIVDIGDSKKISDKIKLILNHS